MPLDARSLFAAALSWTTDDDFPWLRADHGGEAVFLRINTTFPDEPLYSLLVDDGVTVEFDDLPQGWTRGPLEWSSGER
jgi:hypothetical protein